MSTEIAKEEVASPNALVYKLTPTQLALQQQRGIRRRNVETFREAQINKRRTRNAAKRLRKSIRKAVGPVDKSLVGLCDKLERIGNTRIVGKNWRQPRPGRRS